MNEPDANDSAKPFRVAYSALVQNALKDLLERAKAKGILSQLLGALKEIYKRLHDDPTIFGEPLWKFKHTKGHVRAAFVRPLAVVYAVHEQERMAFVTKPIQPLPETGL